MRSIPLAAVVIVSCLTSLTLLSPPAEAEEPRVPGFNERLNQFLGSEGGVQVYQDAHGNIGTLIDPPSGERQFTVQPPQSPWMNVGPPLQLPQHPPVVAPVPGTAPPPTPDFPRRAR